MRVDESFENGGRCREGKGAAVFMGAMLSRCDKWTESATGVSGVTALSLASSVGLWPGCNSVEVIYTACLVSS